MTRPCFETKKDNFVLRDLTLKGSREEFQALKNQSFVEIVPVERNIQIYQNYLNCFKEITPKVASDLT